MRSLALGLIAALLLTPTSASAQVRGLGLFAGNVESRQLRPRETDSEGRTGLLGGAWIDVQLPGRTWSVLAEGAWVERGGEYPEGEVVGDFLAFTVAPSFHLDVAFAGAFAYGGPMLELPLRTRSAAEMEPAFRDPATQVLSVIGGAGVEVRIMESLAFRLEVRHVEGLSPAYTGEAGDFTHRSTEIVVRVGQVLGVLP